MSLLNYNFPKGTLVLAYIVQNIELSKMKAKYTIKECESYCKNF